MFNFLDGSTLEQKDFILEDRKAYIKDFLYSNNVLLIYSPPKQGKTWLGYGITTTLAKREDIRAIIYVDMDNSLSSLNERAIDNKLINIPKVRYVSRAKTDCSPLEYLKKIDDEAKRDNYKDVVFVLETTKDFVDTDSKSQSEEFMKIVMRMRDAGATVIIMHHATKTGKTISGVQVFINSPDNVYEMTQKAKETDKLHFMLNVTHSRTLVKDIGLTVSTQTLELEKLDEVYATMSEYEESFVRKAKDVLEKNADGLNKKELLETLGFEKDDKTANDTINKFNAKFWECKQEKKGKPYNITLIA
ncbi:helicase DnaB [Aliarcobacter butzleri]|uniref:helicase DnaB n=1 Tax=Aliarcobacter butzleri TaxID=28197 RepID=UPI00263D6B27|nr:helicase DnaB [Aliarcobacter butzleri]MDN5049789.1 helicase DnaB [Aliarcobacter butzleri]MDN5056894.1 helicase DnaB [Aliarcobacter butzleri]